MLAQKFHATYFGILAPPYLHLSRKIRLDQKTYTFLFADEAKFGQNTTRKYTLIEHFKFLYELQ